VISTPFLDLSAILTILLHFFHNVNQLEKNTSVFLIGIMKQKAPSLKQQIHITPVSSNSAQLFESSTFKHSRLRKWEMGFQPGA